MSLFVPKTFPQIIGDMSDRLIALTPITDVNFGSVAYTMLEAAAQEDDEQYFQMLEIIRGYSLDTTAGEDLDLRAAEYGLTRLTSQYASTNVTIGDSAITKISTGVFSGLAGAVALSTSINGDSAVGFPASGTIIIGRGTPNAETVNYSSITQLVGYVVFNLASGLINDHGTDESIVLSQGGNRNIPAGTIVKVPASDITAEIMFETAALATILDGEEEVEGVAVVASESGSASNVPIGSISQFSSPPFATAIVRNPERVTNGRDIESDQELRDRIKDTIQSLSRGTGRSLITSAIGVISPEENKRVVSASLIEPTNPANPVKMFIDDGAASPFTFSGIGEEVLKSVATGGEIFLKSVNFPMIKGFSETEVEEPYALVGGETLIVEVDGVPEVITFESTDFAVVGEATAQEVLERINASAATFEARLSSGGVKVRIFARADVNEAIQVTGGTAFSILSFPASKQYTANLYLERDNVVTKLNKDGSTATIESEQPQYYDFSTDKILCLKVDGKGAIPVWFRAANFVNPAQGTAQEVVDVLNNSAPGLTAFRSSNNTRVSIASNLVRNTNSKIQVIENFSYVRKWSGSFTDISASASNPLVNTQIFDVNGSQLYLGHIDTRFRTAYFRMTVFASAVMGFYTQYWNGFAWVNFSVYDGTNGFTQNGHFEFQVPHDWAKANVNGILGWWIRIVRNHAVLATPPTEEVIKVCSANEVFGFSQDAAVGLSKEYTLNRFLGQIELVSPLQAGDKLSLGTRNTRASLTAYPPLLSATFALFGGETLNVTVDGVAQVATFQISDFALAGFATPAEVAARLNADIVGITATVINTLAVKMESNKLVDGSIQVTGGTGALSIGFPTTVSNALAPHVPSSEALNAGPFVFAGSETLIVIIDQSFVNSFIVPMFKEGTAQSGSTSQLVDTGLADTFPDNNEIFGLEVLMMTGPNAGQRRTISGYIALTGTVTFTSAFGSAISSGETYKILPKTSAQVVYWMNNKQITLLSTKAAIKLSSGGTKVQIESLAIGNDASVEVAGGSANTFLQFPTAIQYGVDGYRYWTGLAQITQWTIDGRDDDQENYPGVRAAGVQVEIIEPVKVPIEVALDVTTYEGVTVAQIANDVKSAVSTYINSLPVGEDVILSSVIVAVKSVAGVFDVEVLSPTANIAIADSELARISESEISVG